MSPEDDTSPAHDDGRPRDRRLRVLAVHRYYWPDAPPYAAMLRSITARWAADGHRVDVFSTQPSYKPNTTGTRQPRRARLDGVRVHRIRLAREHERPLVRLLNVGVFSLAVAAKILLGRRYDVVMTSTAPPVVLAWVASWAARARGGRFVYHCMDIHPEIGRVSGDFGNRLVYQALLRADMTTCRRAARIVVLSDDMERSLLRRAADARLPTAVVNNFELGAPVADGPPPDLLPPRAPGHCRIVFTGNVGRFQGLEVVLDALDRVMTPSVELVVMGDGSARNALQDRAHQVTGVKILFVPHQSPEDARAVIGTADLCLVSLTHGIHAYAYPSKTMTYLAEGRPLLAVVEAESELARMVHAEGLGITVPPDKPQEMADVLDSLLADTARFEQIARRTEERGPQVFAKAPTLDRWSRLLRELASEKAAR